MNQSETFIVDKIYNAPVSLVWDAWEDPDKLAQWWRSEGMTDLIITEYDFRPGGAWKQYAILGNGTEAGKDSPGSVFKEIIPYKKIVSVPVSMEEESIEVVPDMLQTVVRFEDLGNSQTRVSISLVSSKQDGWQPGRAVQAAYEEAFDNLGRFVNAN